MKRNCFHFISEMKLRKKSRRMCPYNGGVPLVIWCVTLEFTKVILYRGNLLLLRFCCGPTSFSSSFPAAAAAAAADLSLGSLLDPSMAPVPGPYSGVSTLAFVRLFLFFFFFPFQNCLLLILFRSDLIICNLLPTTIGGSCFGRGLWGRLW